MQKAILWKPYNKEDSLTLKISESWVLQDNSSEFND